MKKNQLIQIKYSRMLLLMAVIFIIIFVPSGMVRAEENEKEKILRVAFPQAEGFSERDEDGTRHGIVVDYLNEIAKYTGWKYEYIDTTGDTMLDEFENGEYDLMGGTYYEEGFEEYFAYPNYNTGHGKSILLASREDDSIKAYDWRSMKGKSIGVYENARENIRRLKEFLKGNDIECTIKEYSRAQLMDGDLWPYLEKGEVDMVLGNSVDDTGRFRLVAEFDSQPHYIVTQVGNQEVLDGLNMALEKIWDANPNFAQECYLANFPDSGMASIYLNSEERQYIENKQTVSVAIVVDWHPLFCKETEKNMHDGLIVDVLKEVQKFTGLTFEYVYADSYKEALELVQQGGADMLGAFLGNEEEAVEMDLALTKSYATLNDIIARNKSVSYPSEGLVGAVLEGREMPKGIKTEKVKYFPNVSEALLEVNKGNVDFFYGLAANMEQEIQSHHYTKVVPNTLVNDRNEICFAMLGPAEAELLTIMDKAINSLSSEKKEALVNQNMISLGIGTLSIIEMLYANPVMFIIIIICIFLLVMVLILVVMRSRVRAAQMQISLERAEAESHAKGEFLSRMSHEIRTPMNAIVGLSDLTCMMEGVPERVRSNLTKIRTSSHYLLGLISDILDMSRIESGMMTIAEEVFSIGKVIEDIKNIMAGDAKQRGLKFIVEEEIRNDFLIGDAVRLKQVLVNLLSNAFKFTDAGGRVLLQVKEVDSTQDEAIYEFRVVDNGGGISEKNRNRIFEAFVQTGTNTSKSQGTGLGLAISWTIVNLMGGELQVKSEPKNGSEFYFTVVFPIGIPEGESEEDAKLEQNFNLEGMGILLAEDNDLNAEIAEELLKIKGAKIQRARDGKEVIDMFRKSRLGEIQAILMDIQMPVMDGLEAARTIRAMDRVDAADIPIIAMTANSFREDVEATVEAGMNGFVTKPIDVDYLYDVLYKAIHG